ncbi:EamA family transporter [Musicola keenii]|uniref:EamA family transporter n=1 Tax=Musicola keenii TaxID=2884250 RepID=UPI00178567E6|nr:EamA family transporter [Musicola keenii]
MTIKDRLLALCVVVIWGVNFVVIKVGLQHMPPLLLAGLRFLLVAFPAILLVPRPRLPVRWLAAYGMTISFGQFAFLFSAIKLGMPVGLASLILQAQAFFTLLIGGLCFGESLRWNQYVGMAAAAGGILVLAEGSTISVSGITLTALLLTLAAAFSWACGNHCNRQIMQRYAVNAMSLVIWSALIPAGLFLLCSWWFESGERVIASLATISLSTVLALMYLSFLSTIIGYGLWGRLLARYDTWRVAPLSLLVPIVGLLSAMLLLGETLSWVQLAGILLVMLGLLINLFGSRLIFLKRVRYS